MKSKSNSSHINLDGLPTKNILLHFKEPFPGIQSFFAAAVSPQESFPPDLFAAPNPNPNPPELSWIQPHLDQNEAKDAQGRLISAIFWTKFLTRL